MLVRRFLSTAVVVATLSAGAAVGSAAAGPVPSVGATAAHRPSAAVSLGDSYIAGEAARWKGNSADPAPGHQGTDRGLQVYGDTVANGCHRSDVAEIVGARLRVAKSINLACSGAQTVNVLRASAGGESLRTEPPQNDQLAQVARSNNVKLVVLSIGGNDLGFSGIVSSCVAAYLTGGPPCSTSQQAAIDARLPVVAQAVTATVKDVRATMAAAGYRTGDYRFILQSYPAPIAEAARNRYSGTAPDARAGVGGCPFQDVDATWTHNTVVPALSRMLAGVARSNGVQFLDLSDAFRGHELCSSAAQQSTGNPNNARSEWFRFVDLTGQGHPSETLHPNYFGQKALGRCLTLATRTHKSVGCRAVPGLPSWAVHLTRQR
jgi:GDSL-like lipase/acylhydrolase family protein